MDPLNMGLTRRESEAKCRDLRRSNRFRDHVAADDLEEQWEKDPSYVWENFQPLNYWKRGSRFAFIDRFMDWLEQWRP